MNNALSAHVLRKDIGQPVQYFCKESAFRLKFQTKVLPITFAPKRLISFHLSVLQSQWTEEIFLGSANLKLVKGKVLQAIESDFYVNLTLTWVTFL